MDLNFFCTTPAVMFVTYILISHFYHILTVVVETKVAGYKKKIKLVHVRRMFFLSLCRRGKEVVLLPVQIPRWSWGAPEEGTKGTKGNKGAVKCCPLFLQLAYWYVKVG